MKPIQIYNDTFLRLISPFMRIAGITLFPFIVSSTKFNRTYVSHFEKTRHLNHENIHIVQQMELIPFSFLLNFLILTLLGINYWWLLLTILPVLNSSVFFIIYLIEFIFKGYRNISFEREAYDNDENLNYLKSRKYLTFTNYF
jgi:hypothetical protein